MTYHYCPRDYRCSRHNEDTGVCVDKNNSAICPAYEKTEEEKAVNDCSLTAVSYRCDGTRVTEYMNGEIAYSKITTLPKPLTSVTYLPDGRRETKHHNGAITYDTPSEKEYGNTIIER
jgi:hypothetical protein